MSAECENAYAVETHASSHRRGGPFTLTFRAEPGAILVVTSQQRRQSRQSLLAKIKPLLVRKTAVWARASHP